MNIRRSISYIFIGVTMLSACVPSKKFNDLQASYNSAVEKNKNCNDQLTTIKSENGQLKELLDARAKTLTNLRADSIETHSLYNKYKKLHQDLNESYEKLIKNCKTDQDRLTSELKDLE